MKANRNPLCATPLEKFFYGIGDIGANLCMSFIGSFITLYYTDSVGLAAAFVGTFMLFARFLDGLSDIACAILIEKAHFKSGKIRPWFIISAPLIAIGTYLCFNIPQSLSQNGKAVFAVLTYVFTSAIAYTIYSIANTAYLPLISKDLNDRNTTSAVQRLAALLGVLGLMYTTPILLAASGGEASSGAWHLVSTIYAILSGTLILCMGLFTREKVDPDEKTTAETVGEKPSLGTVFKASILNKYTAIVLIFFICVYVINGLMQGVGVYYYRDVMGNFELIGPMNLATMVPVLILMPFTPVIYKKFGKKKACLVGALGSFLCTIVKFVAPKSAALFIVSTLLMSVFYITIQGAGFLMVSDIVDYVRKKSGIQGESFCAMASSVGIKIGTGLGSAILGWGLAIGGYVAEAEVQSAATITALKVLLIGIPSALLLVLFVLMNFWDIDKRTAEL